MPTNNFIVEMRWKVPGTPPKDGEDVQIGSFRFKKDIGLLSVYREGEGYGLKLNGQPLVAGRVVPDYQTVLYSGYAYYARLIEEMAKQAAIEGSKNALFGEGKW